MRFRFKLKNIRHGKLVGVFYKTLFLVVTFIAALWVSLYLYHYNKLNLIGTTDNMPLKKEISLLDTVTLNETTLESDIKSPNSLYLLTSKYSGDKFLVASDEKLKSATDGTYVVDLLHNNDFWNPVSCSKVPFVIKDRTIYFLEFKNGREDEVRGAFSLYKFDVGTKKLLNYELGDVKTVGYVYNDNNQIYIVEAVESEGALSKVNVYFFNEKLGTLTKEGFFDFKRMKITNYTLGIKNDNFTLSYFDNNLKKQSLVYSERALKKEVKDVEGLKRYSDGNYRIFEKEGKNYIVKQSFSRFDDLRIEYKDSQTVIRISNDGANKYLITDI